MADIAEIGFRAETSDLVDAKAKLEAISPAAKGAQKASEQLERQMEKATVAAARAAAAQSNAALKMAKASGDATKADIAAATAAKKSADAVLAAARADQQKATAARAAAAATLASAKASDAAAAAAGRQGAAAAQAAGQVQRLHVMANDNRAGAFNMQSNPGNIAAQFQDIGVTAAMDMNPLLIALQQGTQLSAAFANGGLKNLGAALGSLITPLSLVTIGVVALVAAGLQMIDWTGLAVAGLNLLADYLPEVAAGLVLVGSALLYAFGPAIAASIWGIAIAITSGLVAAVGLLVATVGAIPLAIGLIIADLIIFRDAWAKVLGFDLIAVAKDGINSVIGFFVGGYNSIKEVWGMLPNAIGDIMVQVAQAVVGKIDDMVNKSISAINGLINAIPDWIRPDGATIDFTSDLAGGIENPFKGAASGLADTIRSEMDKAIGPDYVGQVADAIGSTLSDISGKIRTFAGGLGGEDGKKKKGRGGKTEAERYDDIVNGAERSIAALQAERDAIGLTAEAAARLKYETDLLNQAKQKNIDLSPKQEAKLRALAGEMASLEVATKKAQEAFDLSKGLVKSFVSDLRSGLENGEGFWQSFANAALNALDTIIDKLLNDVINALFEVNSAAAGGGGGGGLGGILGSILGIFGGGGGLGGLTWETWAKGGSFANGISGHSNTVVDNPTLFAFASGAGIMGEAGPEAIMPLTRGPDGSLGVQMYGNDNGRSVANDNGHLDVAVTVGWSRTADGNLKPFIEDIAQSRANAAVQQYDQDALPYRVNEIAEDRRAR